MAAETKSGHVRAAERRWPGYHVRGTGPYAVVCDVLNTVQLFDWAMLAKVEAAKDCGNWRCAARHKLCVVKPAPEPHRQVIVRRDWED